MALSENSFSGSFLRFIPFRNQRYFTNFTYSKAAFYVVTLFYLFAFSLVVVFEPFLSNESICNPSWITEEHMAKAELSYQNPSYVYNPCSHIRLPMLLFLNRIECSFGRRLLSSVLLGGIVGWERREADRPAGIRTMSLVCLGACLFAINSSFAFIDGPMTWDSSRIAAAIPSGVGFLGAGLIFKENEKDGTGGTNHVVHGLTTSASLWISAAIGVACAGELYFAAIFSVALILSLLRFGPRSAFSGDDDENGDDDDESEVDYGSAHLSGGHDPESGLMEETSPLKKRPSVKLTTSIRKRPALGGIL